MNSALASYQASETLSDGRVVHLRAIRPSDRAMLREQFLKLSKASVRDRFFSLKLDLTADELTFFTEVDFDHHVALVAELESGGVRQPVAVGRLIRVAAQADNAEIAITVTDAMQGQGVGRIMLNHLVDCARHLGVRQMDASVMAGNTRMMKLIRRTGLPFVTQLQDGVQTISVNLCA